MAIAAVPEYMGRDFSSASPGLRFGMYLQVWTTGFIRETDKVEPLKRAGKLNPNDLESMRQLLARQQAAFTTVSSDNGLQLRAIASAPFTTGLGNAHPTENGFAFLSPYGLPYLPGSGVKGVLRQAARELLSGEWGESLGWDSDTINALFGYECDNDNAEHQRGALSFWDVIPQISGESLAVEIMTPHQKHYYQESRTPHDSGQPVPISFLTVPPGSEFVFHVLCDQRLLQHTAPHLLNNWQSLLQAAFTHAFDWLGFGAKTAVGYGAMRDKQQLERARQQRQQEKLQEAGIVVGSSVWSGALVKSVNPGAGEIQIEHADGRLATGKLYSQLSDAAKKRLKNRKQVRVDVEVEEKGNLVMIVSITETA